TIFLLYLSLLLRRPPCSTLSPYTTLFRSQLYLGPLSIRVAIIPSSVVGGAADRLGLGRGCPRAGRMPRYSHYKIRQLGDSRAQRSEEHTSELQSRSDLVCRLLLEKKKHKD